MATKTKIVITGDTSGAVSAVSRLKTELGGLQSLASKALNFGAAIGGTAAVSSMVALTKAAINQGDALAKLSQKTGVSVEDLGRLQHAAELSGVSSDSLEKSLASLAVGMIDAASGGITPAAEQLGKFGIVLRNTDGTVKSSRAVLGELADKFAAMPDGPEKAAAAVAVFGKRLGSEMIPLLNSGAAGLKALGDEADALGIVMSGKLAKQSEEFNDNLDRLSKLSAAAGVQIAGALVPALNEMTSAFVGAKLSGFDMWNSLAVAARDGTVEQNIERITKVLERLRKQQADVVAGKLTVFGTDTKDEIAKQERLLEYYEGQQKAKTDGEALNTAKRIALEQQYQTKYIELLNLRAVAAGKISADILLDDNKRTAAQIKNADAFKNALVAAYQDSIKEAQNAGVAAQKLFDQASTVRKEGADQAADKRRSIETTVNNGPFQTAFGDRVSSIADEFKNVADAADQSATLAEFASQYGRVENAAKLAAQAVEDADRAMKLANQITDPATSADAIKRAADIKAGALETQGGLKVTEQKGAEDDAAATKQQIADLDQQITDLQTKASSLKVSADVAAAEGALKQLQAQLNALQDKTVTVTVNQVGSSDAPIPKSGGDTVPGYAWGGWTGPGSKYKVAGLVHSEEFVNRREVVRQPGALAFLTRFNEIGMAALKGLPGYAAGGLVSNLRIPSLPEQLARAPGAPAGTPVNLYLDGQKVPVTASKEAVRDMTHMFRRQALKRGGRKV